MKRSICYIVDICCQKATKWSERRDAVAELTKLASAKKIAPGDFHEICRTLKKVKSLRSFFHLQCVIFLTHCHILIIQMFTYHL